MTLVTGLTEAQYRADMVRMGISMVGHLYRDSAVPTNWPPDQFDCSVFQNWLNHRYGVDCDLGKLVDVDWPEPEPSPWHKYRGYTLTQQAAARRLGAEISFRDIKPGDRLYYDKPGEHHVVMYIGDGKVVHAAGRAYGVIISPVVGPGQIGHGGKKLTLCVSATKFARAAGYAFAVPKPPAPKPPAPKPPTKPPVKPLPKCDLSVVQTAATRDPGRPTGGITVGAKDDVLLVENALVDLGYLSRLWVDGSFGSKTKEAYKRWQLHMGYSGKDADGIPGMSSLTALGHQIKVKRKFDTVA